MGLRASGGRLAIRLSFGTVAIACVNCCVMIGKVYAALIYILILLYVFSVAFLVADAACSKISCKRNGHFFREKCGGRMSMYFWKRCCVFSSILIRFRYVHVYVRRSWFYILFVQCLSIFRSVSHLFS